MIEPDAGAARAEATRAKELCQTANQRTTPQRSEELYVGGHLMQQRGAVQIGCPAWHTFLPRGAGARPFGPWLLAVLKNCFDQGVHQSTCLFIGIGKVWMERGMPTFGVLQRYG